MVSSNTHLEEALNEYNERVNELETGGPENKELLEALLNRGMILMLMGSFVSSMTDLDDAMGIMDDMRSAGEIPEPGTLVKVHEIHGRLYSKNDPELMLNDYRNIVPHLMTLKNGTGRYDRKSLIKLCLRCSKDLIDANFFEDAIPFLEKGLLFLDSADDDWTENRRFEFHSLLGETHYGMGLSDDAHDDLTRSLDIASDLYPEGRLETEMEAEFIYSFVLRGDISDGKGNSDVAIEDYGSAAKMLERLKDENKKVDLDLLLNLHRTLGRLLMERGNMEKVEAHLVKALRLEIPAMGDAMRNIGAERNGQ